MKQILEKLQYLHNNMQATLEEILEEGITAMDDDTIDCWKERVENIISLVENSILEEESEKERFSKLQGICIICNGLGCSTCEGEET